MNWEALGSIAELVAALAVLVTLIFLTVQVRTNNELTRRANRDKTIDQFNAWRQLIGSNPEVAELWIKGCRGSTLTESEELQFKELSKALFLIYAAWGLRAQENEQDDVVDIASSSLAAELSGEANSAIREFWLEQAPEGRFSELVKQKISS